MSKFSIMVSSCDKFSDLWKAHFDLFFKNWKGKAVDVFLVTDQKTDFSYDGVKIIVESGDMPIRIKKALKHIPTKRVLLTLDDYFTINTIYANNIEKICLYAEENQIDYLLLYNRRWAKKRYYKGVDSFTPIDTNKKYSVNLYPALWEKNFLDNCVEEEMTPWQFEPTLSKRAREYNAKCVFSNAGSFEILDVVRKGRVLHKANKYLKKHHIVIGERKLAKRSTEIKLAIMDFIDWHSPRWLYKFLKKIANFFGMKFYSDD